MKKQLVAAFIFAIFGSVARGQETPVADIAAGYSLIEVINGPSLAVNGGSGSIALNANRWFGTVGDFALYHASPMAGLAAGTYTFGPRFSYRHWEKFTPFTQVLLGGVRYSSNGLAFGAGGGADVALDKRGRFALRPQAEYFGFRANGSTINTVRVCLGMVFRIGRR